MTLHLRKMFIVLLICGLTAAKLPASAFAGGPNPEFRPPAVPLVAFDPYLSIWSENNRLAQHHTRFWDGRVQNLVSLVRVDGKTFRLMGKSPAHAPALHQVSVKVHATTTVYTFADRKIALTLTFLTPRLPAHLKTMTLPVTYISWSVRSTDGVRHQVQIYYSTSSQVAVGSDSEPVVWKRLQFGALTALKCGSPMQKYHRLDIKGDPVGIDWGYVYTAASTRKAAACIAGTHRCIAAFVKTGAVPKADSTRMPRKVNNGEPVEALSFNFGAVGAAPVERHAMVAYDPIYAIDYFGVDQRPYWKHIFHTPAAMLQWAAAHYPKLAVQSAAFDSEVAADARAIGGNKYATIVNLAYRQALAAMGITADSNGRPMVYTKEETSNGDIATVDVIFPASPLLLTFCPQLEAASIVPVLNSASIPAWHFPWAPHDLGTYPICTGHYANGGENMMVEESGNMIIIAAAIAKAEGNADFAAKYWPLLSGWVAYLRKDGFDPGNQISTNDFLGAMKHNANLSIKAIVAMGAYGMLCRMRGMTAQADEYQSLARRWARKWMQVDAQGNHYRMAFTQPKSWSMLYNLVWDQALGLNLFPKSVRARQMAFYMKHLHRYGLPDRGTVTQTKTDFEIWTATLATNPKDFRTIIGGIYAFLDHSHDRVPFADQYGTRKGWAGMHARPVMGAAFMPFMNVPAVWRKWASRGAAFPDTWAPMPPLPPKMRSAVVVHTSRKSPALWHYTFAKPGHGWYEPSFNDAGWKIGPAGFGTTDNGAVVRTRWSTDDIWLRRQIALPPGDMKHLYFYCYHDEDVTIYVNGVFAAFAPAWTDSYQPIKITAAGMRAFHAGKKNLIAVHVIQTTGGQFIDLGLRRWVKQGRP